MCGFTDNKATKTSVNKTVYVIKDIQSNGITSVFWYMEWILNKVYTVRDTKIRSSVGMRNILEGFHSFSSKKQAKKVLDVLCNSNSIVSECSNPQVFKAIIPKNSYYVKATLKYFAEEFNGDPCIISEKLKLTEVI